MEITEEAAQQLIFQRADLDNLTKRAEVVSPDVV
jgi:hypothetical protein